MKIDRERVISRLEEIYECGIKEDGTHTRMAYSDEDIKGREIFAGYFKQLGIEKRMDASGNLFFRLEGRKPSLPAILTGSHLDTVPDGGKYDGVLGCVGGLEICQTLLENHIQIDHPLEVVVFTDEEGFRFGSGLVGSGAICGKKLNIDEADIDLYGNTRGEVMKAYGISVKNAEEAKRSSDSVAGFVELHIEQGGSLDKMKKSIGIVSSIAGVSRYEVVVNGEANHAGSTVMEDRKDALAAASAFIADVPRIVVENGNAYTVATVGTIKVSPNSVNVIPGTCTFSLEIRDQHSTIIELIEKKLRERLDIICKERDVTYSFKNTSLHDPAPMSDKIRSAAERAAQKLGIDYAVVPSGAFHDSLIMTSVFPTGMIFVPSVKGISHSRYEFTKEDDIEKGCNVLLETVLEIDKNEL